MVGGGFLLRKLFGLLAGLLVILSLLAQMVLVPLAEQALTRAAASLPVEHVEIEVDAFPAWKLLRGRIDRLTWQARGVQLRELALDEVQGEFNGVELSWWQWWYQKQLYYSLEVPGEVTCILSERNLEGYLSQRLNAPLDGLEVTIEGEQVELTAGLSVAGQRLPLLLRGRLELMPPDKIKLVPERIRVGNFTPGQEIQEKLLGNTVFQLPLETLPFKLELYRLEGEQGRIKFRGQVFTT